MAEPERKCIGILTINALQNQSREPRDFSNVPQSSIERSRRQAWEPYVYSNPNTTEGFFKCLFSAQFCAPPSRRSSSLSSKSHHFFVIEIIRLRVWIISEQNGLWAHAHWSWLHNCTPCNRRRVMPLHTSTDASLKACDLPSIKINSSRHEIIIFYPEKKHVIFRRESDCKNHSKDIEV